jgi:hypothetical protein
MRLPTSLLRPLLVVSLDPVLHMAQGAQADLIWDVASNVWRTPEVESNIILLFGQGESILA